MVYYTVGEYCTVTVGERLRETRQRRVLTQFELAKQAGVSVVALSRIENGHLDGPPRQRTVRRLARALKVDPAWLLFGEQPDRPDRTK